MYVGMHARMYADVYACTDAFTYACMQPCMCICMKFYVGVVSLSMQVCIQCVNGFRWVCTCLCTYVYMYACRHVRGAAILVCIDVFVWVCIRMYHACVYVSM